MGEGKRVTRGHLKNVHYPYQEPVQCQSPKGEKPQIHVMKNGIGGPNTLAMSAKKESKSPNYMKKWFALLSLLPHPHLRRGSESERILLKQTVRSTLLPHFRNPSQGSGLCYGNGRSFKLDLRSKTWFRLYWVFYYLKSYNYQIKICFVFNVKVTRLQKRTGEENWAAYIFKVVILGKIWQFPMCSCWAQCIHNIC